MAYCPHCDRPLFKGKRVAVIGGGNSGVEAAIDLANIVGHVTLIEFDSGLRADQVLQDKLRSLNNVDIHMSAQTTEILGDGARRSALWSTKTASRARSTRSSSRACSCRSGWCPTPSGSRIRASRCRSYGEIEIDHKAATSLPGVFAAGDCTTVPYKQIVIAMGEGSKAALSAFDYIIRNAAGGGRAEAA